MKLLREFLLTARKQEQQIAQLHETALAHGNALCNLVENYAEDCDDDDIETASAILDKVSKALEMTNKLADNEQRTHHVERINALLASVRDIIQGLVDKVKVKQEENEEDLNTFLDQFLSQIESLVDGDDDESMDDMGMDDDSPSMDMDMEPSMDVGGEEGMPMDPSQEQPSMNMTDQRMEDEEGCSRGMNYRSKARSMGESQNVRRSLMDYLTESKK